MLIPTWHNPGRRRIFHVVRFTLHFLPSLGSCKGRIYLRRTKLEACKANIRRWLVSRFGRRSCIVRKWTVMGLTNLTDLLRRSSLGCEIYTENRPLPSFNLVH